MNEQFVAELKARLDYEASRTAPPDDFPSLPDIPAARYIDPDFFALEMATLWQRSWLFAGHADEVREVGQFKLWRDSGTDILILRDDDNAIRAYYNTCRHRGASVVDTETGQARRLQCTYHGWTYSLKGELIGVPDKRDFVDLDPSCRSLIEVRCECWGQWIFVNLDADARPLLEYLGPAVTDFEQFDLANIRFYDKHSMPIAANWKACLDAFMEVYHLQFIHPDSVHELLDYKASVMGLLANGHSRMFTRNRHGPQAVEEGVPEIDSVGEIPRISNMAYSLFPNFVVPLNPQGFPLLIFWPEGINQTRLDIWWFGPDDGIHTPDDRVWEDASRLSAQWRQRLELFDVVLQEDTHNLPAVQRSMESPAFTGVPLNYQERRIYHAHEAIDACIGRERIPPQLRVEPRLGAFIET